MLLHLALICLINFSVIACTPEKDTRFAAEPEAVGQQLQKPCYFCNLQKNSRQKIVKEFEHCIVVFDDFPVSPGHMLIVSKDHHKDWFSLPQGTLAEVTEVISKMKVFLDEHYKPDGYNIGANCGAVAGQTVMHLHVHLIPRYTNDVEDPRGGVRGVIPAKQKY